MSDLAIKPSAEPFAMDVKEAAQWLRVSADYLAKSDCPRVRYGRRVVYLREDLEAFARQRRTHGAAA